MNQVSDVVKQFFAEYEKASNDAETNPVDLLYNDPFMNADASGVQVVKREILRVAIARRKELFKTLHPTFTRLTALEETRLDEHYALVKSDWHLGFEKTSGQPVDLYISSTFILFIEDNSPRIVFYHPHQNIIKEVQKLGLLAE